MCLVLPLISASPTVVDMHLLCSVYLYHTPPQNRMVWRDRIEPETFVHGARCRSHSRRIRMETVLGTSRGGAYSAQSRAQLVVQCSHFASKEWFSWLLILFRCRIGSTAAMRSEDIWPGSTNIAVPVLDSICKVFESFSERVVPCFQLLCNHSHYTLSWRVYFTFRLSPVFQSSPGFLGIEMYLFYVIKCGCGFHPPIVGNPLFVWCTVLLHL